MISCAYKFMENMPSWTILIPPTKWDTLFYRHTVNWAKENKHTWFINDYCYKNKYFR